MLVKETFFILSRILITQLFNGLIGLGFTRN